MKSAAVYGRKGTDGELFLYRKGVLFATVERFMVALIEESSDSGATNGFTRRGQLCLKFKRSSVLRITAPLIGILKARFL
jgi:hypothetical protein